MRLIFYLLFILFLPSCMKNKSAQNKAKNGPFYWKAEKNGKTSYFLGTVHTGVFLQDLQCFDVIKSHLQSSDYLFVEVDYGSEKTAEQSSLSSETPNNMLDFMPFYSLKKDSQDFFEERGISKGLTLQNYYLLLIVLCWRDVSNNRLMTQNCSSLGFPLDQFCLKDSSAVSLASLDKQIISMARNQGLLVGVLDDLDVRETLTTALFPEASDDVTSLVDAINESVLDFENQCSSSTAPLIQSIRKGEDLTEKGSNSEEFDIALLKNRNEKWVEKFKPAHLKHKQIFTAAGALHFSGNFSMLDMLRAEGFSIKRMPPSCQF